MSPSLNQRALAVADEMAARAGDLRITVQTTDNGSTIIDCGVEAAGGLRAGIGLARVCLADLADVSLVSGTDELPLPVVQVATDHPVLACLASQYAGWQVAVGKFFAMGSGPMRAAYGKEPVFDHMPGRESSASAVGVLETRKLPAADVTAHLAEKLGLSPARLTLLAAPAASIAGSLQVVARSLETALHKLHELHFDLGTIVSGYGTAPLPPIAADEIGAIGRTNDAILYGGRVVIAVRAPMTSKSRPWGRRFLPPHRPITARPSPRSSRKRGTISTRSIRCSFPPRSSSSKT